jgi:hypothetical protein
MNNITVLPSVYTQRNGSYIENNLYWGDITELGKNIYIKNELNNFITSDFESDRFHLSYFLDKHFLWEKFDSALCLLELSQKKLKGSKLFKADLDDLADWFDDSPIFTFTVFCELLGALNVRNEFRRFMFNACRELQKECFECGYPLIVPESIKFELLAHINRKRA